MQKLMVSLMKAVRLQLVRDIFCSSIYFTIALTLLNEGGMLTPYYPAPIDLAMSLNTFPPNSTKMLHRWRVMEAVSRENIRTHHVCGQNPTRDMGISTSAIQEFDPVDMTVKTRSGKIYVLVGQPDNSRLAESAWRKWCKDNGIVAERDVTSEYMNVDQPPTITFKRLSGRPGSQQTADIPG